MLGNIIQIELISSLRPVKFTRYSQLTNIRKKSSDSMKNSQAGFTLIELMVTIAVMGIIASIAIPSFANAINRAKLNRATAEMASLLKTAKVESSIRKERTTLRWVEADKTFNLTFDRMVSGSPEQVKIGGGKFANSISIKQINATQKTATTPTTITFDPAGNIDTPTIYQLCQSGLVSGTQVSVNANALITIATAGECL